MKSGIRFLVIAVTCTLLLPSCSGDVNEVNVYSGRHYRVDEELFREFTERTGIRVNLIKADSDQLINRLLVEGRNTCADLFITADVGRLYRAVEDGVLMSVDAPELFQLVPENLRHPDGYWIGLTARARVIAYHLARVDPGELDSYEDLALDQWRGRILVRSSQSHYNQTLVASMVAANGVEGATDWAVALTANMAQPPRGNDRDQMKALVAGIGDVAIVNTYYLGLLHRSDNEEEHRVAEQVGLFFPNQKGRGAHINLSGMGVTTHAKNKQNALQLMAFLLEKDAQQRFAFENFEHPVTEGVELPEIMKSWGDFKVDTINASRLGNYLPDAMMIFNKVGWQ